MKLTWLLGAAVAILSVPVQWGEGQLCTEDEAKEELERILGVRKLTIVNLVKWWEGGKEGGRGKRWKS